MKLKINLEIPEASEVLEALDPATINPKIADAELELAEVETATAGARKKLLELTQRCESLPVEIAAGRISQKELVQALDEERAAALSLEATEAKLRPAREKIDEARADGRALLVADANKILAALQKAIDPLVLLLETTCDFEYMIENVLERAHQNPAGTGFPRAPSPSLRWPACMLDIVSAQSWAGSPIAEMREATQSKALDL